jgi:hypothetical protein
VSVEVQENDVRKELKKHFSWGVFLPTHDKIELFVALFKQVVCGLDPDHVSVSRHDYRDGALGYAALDDVLVENLLQQCRPYCPPEELTGLKRFLESQKESDGVMALRVRHQYGILKSPGYP